MAEERSDYFLPRRILYIQVHRSSTWTEKKSQVEWRKQTDHEGIFSLTHTEHPTRSFFCTSIITQTGKELTTFEITRLVRPQIRRYFRFWWRRLIRLDAEWDPSRFMMGFDDLWRKQKPNIFSFWNLNTMISCFTARKLYLSDACIPSYSVPCRIRVQNSQTFT